MLRHLKTRSKFLLQLPKFQNNVCEVRANPRQKLSGESLMSRLKQPLLNMKFVGSMLILITFLTHTPHASAAPNSIEIFSIEENSQNSVDITFFSNIAKGQIATYEITARLDKSGNSLNSSELQVANVISNKPLKKIVKIKATGLITYEFKPIAPQLTYVFTVAAKTKQNKIVSSEPYEYVSLTQLSEIVSNLPSDWGNPKPIQLPTPTNTTPALAAPAFTLSSSSETRTVNTSATGFTVNSTGGTIASFAISSTPSGMSFNTTTGALTGTPDTVAASTSYTVTATNASGSATATFALTVSAVVYTVGQTGPGGGTVFYVATTPFACGPTLATTCSYLEAAPTSNTVANYWTDARYVWGAFIENNGDYAIGSGYSNTLAMVTPPTGDNTANRAGTVARAYRGPNNLSDWFLPSKDELNALYEARTSVADLVLAGVETRYWSSSKGNGASRAERQYFNGGNQYTDFKSGSFNVRPIRAF
jgi:hypothetical protein